MDQLAIKEVLYSGLLALMQTRTYYFHSEVGAEYSHWTEAGLEEVVEYTKVRAELMLTADAKSLDKRAKELVIRGLKGETL